MSINAMPGNPQQPAHRIASDYSAVLKAVQARGLMQPRYAFYAFKVSALLLALAGVWVGFAFLGAHWAQVAIAAGLGVVLTQLLFLSHDAAHRQIFRSSKANEWAALLLGTGLGGVSLGWWNAKHSKHHRAPNQIGRDPDITPSLVHFYPAERTPRSRIALLMLDHQGWWFFPLLLVEALHLHAQSVAAVASQRSMKRRGIEASLLAVRLGAYPAALFVFLPWGLAAAFLGIQLAATGLYLGSAFSASHIGMPTVPQETKIDFLRRQVLVSRNVSGGRIASVAMGGLNYQIEHHLFPAMPRPNLRRARPIVRAFCADHAIDYHEIPIHRAWVAVARHLNRVGISAGLAVRCPTAAALR